MKMNRYNVLRAGIFQQKNFWLCCFVLFLFSSCYEKNVRHGYFVQNFDNLHGWMDNALITTEQAHSANYCTYTDSTHEKSQVFDMDMDFARGQNYKRLQVTAWCQKTVAASTVSLVASVTEGGRTLAKKTLAFSDGVEVNNTWVQVVFFLDLPGNASNEANIRVYMYSPQKEKAFLDDVELRFTK
jgi:hypothetical protein